MVLMAVLAAGVVTPVLVMMVKRAGAPVPALLVVAGAAAAVAVPAVRVEAGVLPAWWLPVPWVVAVLGMPLALADLRHHRLPDVLTWPAYPAIAIALVLAATGGGPRLLTGAVAGCLLFGGAHLLVHRLSAGGLGAGDVKLSGALGAVLGALGGETPIVAAALAATASLTGITTTWFLERRPSSPPPQTSPGQVPDNSQPWPHDDRPASPQPPSPDATSETARLPAETPRPDHLFSDPTIAAVLESSVLESSVLESPAPDPPTPDPPTPDPPTPEPPTRAPPASDPAAPEAASPPVTRARAGPGRATVHPTGPLLARAVWGVRRRGVARRRRGWGGPGRMVVPHGPGLVLATWVCAVFPAAGTGVV
ncbi:prepilin peptidase [Amycolatopsis jiangsuensis]|uniref:Flp pilus assembly protein protease CpaA n=1 Tax=Amycolatopsis jiangsuensis TaxID=1181879 RepID=A0A840IS59_9PSEU|nr:A24 family peptidase [Amycolatopsis jiangsuensis]MBB4684663.1 Flp pilus assembly protein protease CpaA [Amycolatopsis jiangsuensis]